jgi:cell pole-organizing protein PopZ
MDNARSYASPSLDEFLAAILDRPNPASTAEFVAEILGENDRASAAAFAAAILDKPNPAGVAEFVAEILGEKAPSSAADSAAASLREYNFNPDEPRDERGRWTTGGSHNDRLNTSF